MYDTRVTSASLRMDTVTALTVREGRRMAISPEKRLSAPTMLGVPIGVDSLDSLLDSVGQAVQTGVGPFTVACANPHSLVVAQQDETFRRALQSCSAVVADGSGVTLAARLLKMEVGPRITGTDFFLGAMRRLDGVGGKAFFLGSVDPVLNLIKERVKKDFPRVTVETLSPPFGTWSAEQQAEVMQRIRAARADVLWVGMTAPKQEKWIHSHAEECGAPVVGAIGAVFDYYAGTVHRAPLWICKLGFEWLYRLLGEPKRLWRRTLVSGPQFAWLLLRERLRARGQRERVACE
jgi:N-acetylglucosaminyldiphosphoundecaprenol N-acetyl-beta-D-mannosaminyltransferase